MSVQAIESSKQKNVRCIDISSDSKWAWEQMKARRYELRLGRSRSESANSKP